MTHFSPQLEIESAALRHTVDLGLLRAAADHLEPDTRFEPHATVDTVTLADADCRAAFKRIGSHVAILFGRWLEQNGVTLNGQQAGYVSRCAREQVAADELGLLRAMVKLHTAGHEPRDPFERYSSFEKGIT